MNTIKIGVIYPTDPAGSVIGGVDSFIRGLIKYSPEDIEYIVFGATTDAKARPVRRWSECVLGERRCSFFPVMRMNGSGRQPRVPATLTYELSSIAHPLMLNGCDILESHRIEHFLLRGRGMPLNLFMHQDMAVLEQSRADIRWRLMPTMYRRLERRVLHRAASIHCVREEAVSNYKKTHPSIKDKFRFQSTWMDPDIFYPANTSQRAALRDQLRERLKLPIKKKWLIAVGRLDYQKDPLLMIKALDRVMEHRTDVHLIWVGAGILRDVVVREMKALGLAGNVTLTGLLLPGQVADLHRAADLFVMSSAYEGMPIALIEAMACGLPVVTTDVGEIRRLVIPDYNGEICLSSDPAAFANAVSRAVDELERYAGSPCTEIAGQYTPKKVLEPVYSNYRVLAGSAKRAGHDL